MDDFDTDFEQAQPPAPNKPTFWRKLGGGSLTLSILFHAVLIVVGLVWVLQILPPPPEKKVDFMPQSGGGGSPASESQAKKHQVRMAQPNLQRVTAVGATSTLTLPEPDDMTQMTSLGSLSSSGGLSKGLGGSGAGGGKGTGNGTGFGAGMAPGLSDGTGNKNPFGMVSSERGALLGTFYDLKQTDSRKPTEMTDDQFRETIREIVENNLRDSSLRKYFKAPRELYQTKLHIPIIPADAAPAAFEVEKEVQPKRWIVIYRGAVQAPKTGKFRFVGASDDLLYVRLAGKPVFDYGYTIASTGSHIIRRSAEVDGTTENAELAYEIRKLSPMRVPIKFYKYDSTPGHNNNIGGMAIGPEFEVEAGKTYPIDILTGEIPGGFFSVTLLIEEIGATYQKDPAGCPILPLFRLDNTPPARMDGQAPPFAADGPVWKYVAGGAKKDI